MEVNEIRDAIEWNGMEWNRNEFSRKKRNHEKVLWAHRRLG